MWGTTTEFPSLRDGGSVILLLLFVATLLVGVANGQYATMDFWNIRDPLWDYGGNVFDLNYEFNDMVERTMIQYKFYTKGCPLGGGVEIPQIGGTGYDIIVAHDESQPLGDGSGTRSTKVTFLPNEFINDNPQIYDGDYQDEEGNWYANVELCARVSLHTDQGTEINFLENQINVKYVFTDGGLTVSNVNVEQPVIDLSKIELGVKLKAYDCSLESNDGGFLSQGMVIRVCVEPIQEAIQDGFRMKAIEWFTYEKNMGGVDDEEPLTQEAVVNRTEASNELTRLTCNQGEVRCVVETMLVGAFFSGNGTVEANGLATMQLGTHSSDSTTTSRRRGLNDPTSLRSLQEATADDDTTISKEFDVEFQSLATKGAAAAAALAGTTTTTSSYLNSILNDIQSNNANSSSTSSSMIANVVIVLLLVLNLLTVTMLIFQHKFFRNTWFYL